MLTIDGKVYRNLEEQVKKNKDDIEYILNEQGVINQFGIKVVGVVASQSLLPSVDTYKQENPNWEYGDTFAIGTEPPYDLFVLTRANLYNTNDYWFDIGDFPLAGPKGETGPQGPQGLQGPTGAQGIQGPTGLQGIAGPQGPMGVQGPTGPRGEVGPQGPTGEGFKIIGVLTNISQLPTPSEENRNEGYLVDINGINHMYLVTGSDTLVWTDCGPIEGIQGPQGPVGPQGPQGPQGLQGIQGQTGAQGNQGPAGNNAYITINGVQYSNVNADNVATSGSSNLITSGAVYNAVGTIDAKTLKFPMSTPSETELVGIGTNGAQLLINKNSFSQLVAEFTSVGNEPSLVIDNLDIASDGGVYDFEISCGSTTTGFGLRFNDWGDTYYGWTQFGASGNWGDASRYGASGRQQGSIYVGNLANGPFIVTGTIKQHSNNLISVSSTMGSGNTGGASSQRQLVTCGYCYGLANLTKIVFISNGTFRADVKVRIYKRATNSPTRG